MATDRTLLIPPGYDAVTNPRVASFAAQLDDQLALLKKHVSDLEVAHLEWQPRPGVNTVGMLLAHLAIVDVWWISIATRGLTPGPDTDAVFRRTIGIGMDDDGMPVPPDGGHPPTLAGKHLTHYLRLLDAARASTHDVMRTWRDIDLSATYTFRDRSQSREWTVYHVLEHFCGHYGQVLLLKHLMRDADVLAGPPPK
jgi:uncharacterized damage-inducible protein DinB